MNPSSSTRPFNLSGLPIARFPWAKMMLTVSMTALLISPVWAADGAVQAIRYNAGSRSFAIDASGPVRATVNTLSVGGRKRIIIDIDNAEIGFELPRDAVLLKELADQGAGVVNLSVNQFRGERPVVRILMDVNSDVNTARVTRNDSNHIELQLDQAVAATPVYHPSSSGTHAPYQPQAVSNPAMDEMKRSLAVLSERVQRLTQENQDLTIQLRAAERGSNTSSSLQVENNSLKTQLRSLESQLASVRQNASTSASSAAEVDRYRQRATNLESQLSNLQRSYDLLKQQQATATATKSAGSTELQQARQQAANLESQLANLKRENERLRQEQANLVSSNSSASDARIEDLRSQLQMAQGSLSQSIAKINEQNREIVQLRGRMTEVQRGFDASAKQQITLLQESLDEKDAQIKELQTQLAAKPATSATTAASNAQVDALRKQLEKITAQYKNTVAELDSQRQKNQQEIVGLKGDSEQLALLQQNNDSLAKEIAQLRSQTSALQNDKAALQKTVDALKTEKTTATASKTPESKTIALLKSDNIKLAQENKNLKASLAQATSGQTATTGGASQGEITELKQALLQADARYEEANKAAEDARKELATLKAAKPAATKAGSSADTMALQKKYDSLNAQYQAAMTKLAAAQKEAQSLRLASGGKTGAGSAMLASTSVTMNPTEADRHYQAARTALSGGDKAKAINELALATDLDPRNSQYVLEYSSALAEDQQLEPALKILQAYLEKNPYDRDAYNQLGKVYLLNDQTDAARQAFSRALPISTLNNYATTLKKLDRKAEAEEIFKLANKLNPQDSEVLFNLGNLYNSDNKLEQARQAYSDALKLKPDFAEAHYNIGLIYSKMGKKTEAISHLQKFLDLSPNARNAGTIRTYLEKLKAPA